MADKKKKEDGKGGIVLTDEQKLALIKTGNPDGEIKKYRARAEDLKKANAADLSKMALKKKAAKK